MSDPIFVREGDLFVVDSASILSGAIKLVQCVKALDCEAIFNHAGIILNEKGETYESLYKIDHYNLDHYLGKKILIVRHCGMSRERYDQGMIEAMKCHGKLYPFWRLPLHLIGLAKFIHWRYPVCSELVTRFLYGAKLLKGTGWGWTPDNLSDFWTDNINYIVVARCDEFPGVYHG
jgi:hypothetical protein